MHATVSKLPANVKSKAAAGVLFGDTKNKQSGGYIANYPKDKVKILCAKEDGVCWGTLDVSRGHLVYITDGSAKKATDFLIDKLGMTGIAAPAAPRPPRTGAPSGKGGNSPGKGAMGKVGPGKGGSGKGKGGSGKVGIGKGGSGKEGLGKGKESKGTPPVEPAA
jgi:cutinase